jgi:hypothetical protein
MKKLSLSVLLTLLVLLLTPSSWAGAQLVDTDGTFYSVDVVPAPDGPAGSTVLAFTRVAPNGARTLGLVDSTATATSDRDPALVRLIGSEGPSLLWSKKNGPFEQIAFSHFDGYRWGDPQFLTSTPGDHRFPQAGIDAWGTGYVIWVEMGGEGSVMLATFDPLTGNLLFSPQDLFRELVRHSPPQWLAAHTGTHPPQIRPGMTNPDIFPDGGSDAPIVPPAPKDSSPVSGTVTLSPACNKVVAAVERNRLLWIGVLQNGVVLDYYRAAIPAGAPGNYTSLLLQGLLERHCR